MDKSCRPLNSKKEYKKIMYTSISYQKDCYFMWQITIKRLQNKVCKWLQTYLSRKT